MPYIGPKANVPVASPSSNATTPVPPPPTPVRRLSVDCSGQPLKPALKICRSHSNVERPVFLTQPYHHVPTEPPFVRETRQRTKSAPAPTLASAASSPSPSPPPSPTSPSKTVRWPTDAMSLERVRIFRKHGKPIHVSNPADDTGTETEGESSSAVSGFRYEAIGGFAGFSSSGTTSSAAQRDRRVYPSTRFPKAPLSSLKTLVATLPALIPPLAEERESSSSLVSTEAEARDTLDFYEVDEGISSPIPSRSFDPHSNVHLESLRCASTTDTQTTLEGVILVRNVAYTKDVTCRFTLDEWSTTSNVSARYIETLPSFPLSYFPSQNRSTTLGDAAGLISMVGQMGSSEWDRFRFAIVVEHGGCSLESKTLWLAVRYAACGGTWWDNNAGQNYKIGFRLGARPPRSESPTLMTAVEAGKGTKESEASNGSHSAEPALKRSGPARDCAPPYRRPKSPPPVPHTSHSLLPIQPKGASPTSSPLASQRYSSLSPLAYPGSANIPELKLRPEWKRERRAWALGNVQVSSVVACRIGA